MSVSKPIICVVGFFCLALLASTLLLAGCSSDAPDTTTTSPPSTSSSTTTAAADTTTTSLPEVTNYDRELASTATIQHELTKYLSSQGVADTDPRIGIVYGLKARQQALSCRKALDAGELDSADSAMREIRYSLNLGADVATSAVAQTLFEARALIASFGDPSEAPDAAAVLADKLIATLAPLLDQAKTAVPSTTST